MNTVKKKKLTKAEQQKKWSDAAKKAWKTRRANEEAKKKPTKKVGKNLSS